MVFGQHCGEEPLLIEWASFAASGPLNKKKNQILSSLYHVFFFFFEPLINEIELMLNEKHVFSIVCSVGDSKSDHI